MRTRRELVPRRRALTSPTYMEVKMADSRLCSIPDCGKRAHARGWCTKHYQRWGRHGDPVFIRTPAGWGASARFLRDVVLPYDGDDCLTWPFTDRGTGYGRIRLDGREVSVNRIICEAEHGPPPTPKHEATHSCGNGHLGCVTKRHLRWGTHAENMADKLIHDTNTRGERHGAAKLTTDDVREIRSLLGSMPQTAIAKQFGVTRGAVKGIARGHNWAWLD